MLPTIDNSNKYVVANQKVKVHGKCGKVEVEKTYIVKRYNAYMNGVGRFDQIFSKNNLSHKCVRW